MTAVVFLVLPFLGALLTRAHSEFLFGDFEEFHKDVNDGNGTIWALLVAGSRKWDNYRHQADVCHSYHVLRNHGIPEEQIIVMMTDDIAYNKLNPTPGIIINRPNGTNVYEGIKIDYSKSEVTAGNFLNILQGKDEAMSGIGNGKVIKSGPNDHIFVNFVDHGAPGFVMFPNTELSARKLNNAIKEMHSQNSYAQMVLYIEACEAGSMFDTLLNKDLNVYATTASNSHESSFACYYDDKRETYLGDVYSVMWMQDSEKENLDVETLQKQYQIVKDLTNTSHVMQYGDFKISEEVVGEFQGEKESPENNYNGVPTTPTDVVRSEDVAMAILERMLLSAISEEEEDEITEKMENLAWERGQVQQLIMDIVGIATVNNNQNERMLMDRKSLYNHDCYETVYYRLKEACVKLNLPENDYALRHLYIFVNMCEEGIETEAILESIDKICF